MRCEKGATAENLESTSRYLAEAVARDVDIVGFPEMSITGYADPTRYPEAILHLDGPEVAQVVEMTRGQPVTLLAGLIEANPRGKPFITHMVPVFTHGNLTFGMAICADVGNQQVFAECARQGARIVFELAAPGLYGEQATRNWQSGFEWWEGKCQKHLSRYAREYGIWIAVATQAGRTIDEDFPGGGYVFAPDGRRLYATPDWSPGAVYVEIGLDAYYVQTLA
jgi:predicted amidohydrolase